MTKFQGEGGVLGRVGGKGGSKLKAEFTEEQQDGGLVLLREDRLAVAQTLMEEGLRKWETEIFSCSTSNRQCPQGSISTGNTCTLYMLPTFL